MTRYNNIHIPTVLVEWEIYSVLGAAVERSPGSSDSGNIWKYNTTNISLLKQKHFYLCIQYIIHLADIFLKIIKILLGLGINSNQNQNCTPLAHNNEELNDIRPNTTQSNSGGVSNLISEPRNDSKFKDKNSNEARFYTK